MLKKDDLFNMIEKSKNFFKNELKLIFLITKNYNDSQSQIWASSLTYFSILAIFPIIALMLGITKGFGIDLFFEQKLLEIIPQNEKMMLEILKIAENLLSSTKGSVLTGVGIIILLWSSMRVLMMLEDAFNTIWRIKKRRLLARRIIDYVAIIFLSPILFIVLIASNSLVINKINESFTYSVMLNHLFINIIAFIVISLIFTTVFIVIPNTNVNYKPAFIAGITTTIIFTILKLVFSILQNSISNYNAIYGSLAFIPIFLIRMQYVWVTILIGAQITYSAQNAEEFMYSKFSEMPIKIRKSIGVSILKLLIDQFQNLEKPYTYSDISKKLDIPAPIIKDTLNDLEEMSLINEVINDKTHETTYQIAINPNKLSIEYFINRLENKGFDNDTEELESIIRSISNRISNEIDENISLRNSKLIKDIKI